MADKFHVTLVRSKIPGRPYAKKDGVYAGPTWINDIGLQTIPDTSEAVFKMMKALGTTTNTCMVYGTANEETIIDTNRTMKNFKEEPINIVTLDLDRYSSPNMEKYGKNVSYEHVVQDVDGFIREYLPPEFSDVSYTLRCSSSFLKSQFDMLKVHIIFLLGDPQYPREIGLWLKRDKIPADTTFYFNLTQPVFTAFPIWDNMVDPLKLLSIPRITFQKRRMSRVYGDWQPFRQTEGRQPTDLTDLPNASILPGKVGSFCRMMDINKIMSMLGYTDEKEGRWLSSTSGTGVPGAMVFSNGYVYSHHDGDPINKVVEHIYNFKRRSLNAHDLMHGWAIIHKEKDPAMMRQYEYMMSQAIIGDTGYQDEVQAELVERAEWLEEGEYDGVNRKIIEGLFQDMQELRLNDLSKDHIFNLIKAKTKQISKSTLNSLWRSAKRDQAFNRDDYDPEAGLRHMADIFKRQKLFYSHHGTSTGDYWCYFKDTRLWRKVNQTQAKGFIYRHLHESMPVKIEIDVNKVDKLTRIIMQEACLEHTPFIPGKGWAFRGGRYGIIMRGLFAEKPWKFKESIRTLKKDDFISKELPITYKQWQNAKGRYPEMFVDFLIASTEEEMESVELIREYGGYILADSYYIHKMLIVEGIPGSGKSILAKVIQSCIGRDYYTATSINGLSGQYGLGSMPNAKLAVMSEARAVDFGALRGVVPVLLKIIGNDFIDIDAKYKSAITEKIDAKLMMMTNKTPVIPDDTGALIQRLMLVQFKVCFRGTDEEILGLDDKIMRKEIAPIIRWFMEGLEHLSARQRFIEPESGLEIKQDLATQIDPLKTFIEDFFIQEKGMKNIDSIPQPQFTHFFRMFLKRIGQNVEIEKVRKRCTIRDVKTLCPKVVKSRANTLEGKPFVLCGLRQRVPLEMEFATELEDLQ